MLGLTLRVGGALQMGGKPDLVNLWGSLLLGLSNSIWLCYVNLRRLYSMGTSSGSRRSSNLNQRAFTESKV